MTGSNVLIVECGWGRGTLCAARSLASAGNAVSIASQHRGHAARSRSSTAWFRVPEADDPTYVDRVCEIADRGRYDVVFAGDDENLLALSGGRDRLGSSIFPHPHDRAVRSALDKLPLYATARTCGLAVPETTSARPGRHDRGWIAKQRMYCAGRPHTYSRGSGVMAPDEGVIYQRVLNGHLLAVVTLTDPAGRHLYMGAQRAETLSPEPFGASARARLVPLDKDLVPGVVRLLECLEWWGLAELQFVVPPDGVPHLIDFNGRFFGSLALTCAAGVDLPAAWLAVALGEPPGLGTPSTDTRYQWLEGDLRRAWRSRGGRGEQVWGALRYAPGAAHSLWSPSDPAPAARQLGDIAWRTARRVL
jgi:predicted ATP-grasp superfamily ATP-dependent carboligase